METKKSQSVGWRLKYYEKIFGKNEYVKTPVPDNDAGRLYSMLKTYSYTHIKVIIAENI